MEGTYLSEDCIKVKYLKFHQWRLSLRRKNKVIFQKNILGKILTVKQYHNLIRPFVTKFQKDSIQGVHAIRKSIFTFYSTNY